MLATTQMCCSYLDGQKRKYTLLGENVEGHDIVEVIYIIESKKRITPIWFVFILTFYPDASVSIYCELFDAPEEKRAAAILFAYEQNKINRFGRFVYYSDRQAILLEAEVVLERSSTGRTLYKTLMHLIEVGVDVVSEWGTEWQPARSRK